jgi:signal transduction histidine kinase
MSKKRLTRTQKDREKVEVLLHELKQPLFSANIVSERLEGYAEKLLSVSPQASLQLSRDVRILVTSLQQFKEIIDTYAVIDCVEYVRTEWSERFVRQIEALEMITRARTVDFSFECSLPNREDGPDLAAIGHILRNLVMNALLAAGENANERKPFVLVQLMRLAENAMVIAVHDSGSGVRLDVRDKVFERGVSTRIGKGGSGYGLWVCRKLATALGGKIELADSSLTGGACFTVTVPLRDVASATSSAA